MNKVYDPVATYRIQFNKEFTFSQLEAIIPYLEKLGIRTLYASPIFQASPGSMHGYDGTDPNAINKEIGTEEQLVKISNMLKEKGIQWLQDIVPNHLSFHEDNPWLMDVLAKGTSSKYSSYFDIDWNHPKYGEKLMVPFPGSSLEEKLKNEFPEADHYIPVPWQETDKSINYRRFFTVNSLICTNIQYEHVFEVYHTLIKKLSDAGVFAGLRVDHVDGLYDPKKYLEQLRMLGGDHSYIVVEKILEPHEQLPNDWPIQGNSGYDFLGIVNNLFTNKKSEKALTEFYDQLTGDNTPVAEQVHEKKSYILLNHMAGELDNLCRLYKNAGLGKNLSDNQIKKSIAEYLISCPVYRYYGDEIPLMEHDKGARAESIQMFYPRAMQFSGPLMAKGVEDTLMYTYNRFIGHNEVGDSPEVFGYTVDEFHELMEHRVKHWPLSLNASSTHDTKRGEDARARLNALTDRYEEWIALVKKWKEENNDLRKDGMPDNNDEYFIYQTLVATYPTDSVEEESYSSRLKEYLQKALREAKVHSNWAEPNTKYEDACIDFSNSIMDKKSIFWKSFHPFLQKITNLGMINSFGQLVLKFTCPGVPDLYQGTEFWDLSMVDPDNRRPVDFNLRSRMLNNSSPLKELWTTRNDSSVKFSLVQKLLAIRNRYADLFRNASYAPVNIIGEYASNVIAFLRTYENTSILSVVPLHLGELSEDHTSLFTNWKDTRLLLPSSASWQDLINGGSVKGTGEILVKDLFERFPVAVLA